MKKIALLAATAMLTVPLWSVPASAAGTMQACEEKIDTAETNLRKLQRTKFIPRTKRRDLREMIEQAEFDRRYRMYDQCLEIMEEVQTELVYIRGRQRQ